MYKILCKIEGMVPLLMARFPLPEKGKVPGKKTKGNSEKVRVAELEAKAFKDERGMYIPTDNLRMMLIGNKARTGAAKILGSQIESGKGTAYLNFCKAFIWVVGLEDKLKVYFRPERKVWDDTDMRSFVTSTGGRDYTERPQINCPWSLEFEVHVMDESIGSEKIRQMYEVAGLRCGLGVYGPTFGRFRVTEWEVMEEDKAN